MILYAWKVQKSNSLLPINSQGLRHLSNFLIVALKVNLKGVKGVL